MSLPPSEPPTDLASIPAALVIDTSVVSAVGRPDNPKYRAFAELFTAAGATACVPPSVIDEIGGSDGEAYEAPTRVRHGERRGWLERVPAFEGGARYRDGPTAGEIADRVRARMADRFGVPDHEVEKTDTLLPGVAVQLLASGGHDRTGVVIKDRHAAQAAHAVLTHTAYEDLIRIYRGRPFLEFAVEWADDLAGGEDSHGRGIY